MTVDVRSLMTAAGWLAAGALIGVAAAPTALAEPVPPPPGPMMLQAPDAPIVNAAAPVGPAPDAPPPILAPADGAPHLASPDAPRDGTTMDPVAAGADSPNTSYLKDLWHAVQNQEISGKEALILGLSQRGMNTPIPQQAPGPNVPTQFPRDLAAAPPPPADPALTAPPADPPPAAPLPNP